MVLFRITSANHARDLSGTGARLYGGRWNSKGTSILYTSESLSLATLETIANLSGNKLGKNLHCIELDFPDHLPMETILELPKDWHKYPFTSSTVKLGDQFFRRDGFCLKVPSAIIPNEFNVLLNPLHELFTEVKFLDSRPFFIDRRLLQ